MAGDDEPKKKITKEDVIALEAEMEKTRAAIEAAKAAQETVEARIAKLSAEHSGAEPHTLEAERAEAVAQAPVTAALDELAESTEAKDTRLAEISARAAAIKAEATARVGARCAGCLYYCVLYL